LKHVRIRQVKPEIRVLGVAVSSAGSNSVVVGAVFRGSLFLDGVMSRGVKGNSITYEISDMIKTSKHYGQVRVILIDESILPVGVSVDPYFISEFTGKPVLYLHGSVLEIDERYMFKWCGRFVTSIGLSELDASNVLNASSKECVPEALRVASMVAASLSDGVLHKV
jgi:endonuclease V-like protein UPF0215 family